MRIRRTLRSVLPGTLIALALAAAAVGAHGWAVASHGAVSVLAWVLTLIAVALALLLAVAATSLGEASCPRCGARVRGLQVAAGFRPYRCRACDELVAAQNGELVEIPADYVHPTPLFTVALGKEAVWPAVCCECGEPSTRRAILADPESRWRFEIPYCAEHDDAVELRRDPVAAHLIQAKFRSHAYYRAFKELNLAQKN